MRNLQICGGSAPAYAQNPQSESDIIVPLDGELHEYQIGGDFLLYTEGPRVGMLAVRLNYKTAPAWHLLRGDSIDNRRFSHLYITSTVILSEQFARLIVNDGPDPYARQWTPGHGGEDELLRVIEGTQTLFPTGPLRLESRPDVIVAPGAPQLIIPADTLRRFVIFRSHPDNVVSGRWGDEDIGAAQGVIIQPGEIVRSDNRDNFFGWTAGPEDMTIAINEEQD